MLRRVVRRSLALRGYSLTDPTIVPGKYDRAEKSLLSPPSQVLHEKRLKNRARVQRQLERKRAEKQQVEFVARFKYDPGGGVWTCLDSEEVGWIDSDGPLEMTDRRFTADEVRLELKSAIEVLAYRLRRRNETRFDVDHLAEPAFTALSRVGA